MEDEPQYSEESPRQVDPLQLLSSNWGYSVSLNPEPQSLRAEFGQQWNEFSLERCETRTAFAIAHTPPNFRIVIARMKAISDGERELTEGVFR